MIVQFRGQSAQHTSVYDGMDLSRNGFTSPLGGLGAFAGSPPRKELPNFLGEHFSTLGKLGGLIMLSSPHLSYDKPLQTSAVIGAGEYEKSLKGQWNGGQRIKRGLRG
ncbi:MAG: hypothetical protein R2827_15285 [Bdellovibrionales bacterium]